MSILTAALCFSLCYLLQLFLYRRFWDRGLTVSLFLSSAEADEGGALTLTEIIENRSLLPLPALKVKFRISRTLDFENKENSSVSDYYYRCDIFSVMPYQRITRELPFTCTKRGYYTIEGYDVCGSNLFMTESYIRSQKCQLFLYVYPGKHSLDTPPLFIRQVTGDYHTKRLFPDDPFAFRGIREYRSSDPMRRINWKASAKTGQLLVNLYGSTSQRSVRLYLDVNDGFTAANQFLKEENIRIAAFLAACFIGEGVPVALYSNGRDILDNQPVSVPPGSGRSHILAINRKLARLDLSKEMGPFPSLFRNRPVSPGMSSAEDYSVIISASRNQKLLDVLLHMKRTGHDFFWICPSEKGSECRIPVPLTEHTKVLELIPE